MAGQDIGPRIGLGGASKFQRDLRNITQQCKELDAEMKAVTSSFDANDSSQDKLTAQMQVLGRQIDTQKQKINLLNDQYDKATTELGRLGAELQEATQAYGAQSKEATQALRAYQNQSAAVSKLQTDIYKATTTLNNMEKAQADITKEMQTGRSAFDRLTDSIDEQEAELKSLKKQYQNAVLEFGDASDEAQELGKQIEKTSTELKQSRSAMKKASDAADDLDKSLDGAADSGGDLGESFSKLGNIVSGNVIADGIAAVVGGLKDLHDESMEYRKIMASLEASSELAGYSADQTSESYKTLVGVLADTQTAATTTANLQALNLEQSELNTLINGTIGAWAKFGDSIPIDGLAESITETARTGQVTGNLADVLNWTAGEEDAFNEELSTTQDESERARKIIQKLTDYGLVDMGKEWQSNNKSMTEYNQATDDLDSALANLGETAEPVLTDLIELLADLLEGLNDLAPVIDGLSGHANTIADTLDSIGFDDVTAKIDSLTEAQKNQVTVFMEQNAAGKSFGEQMNLLNTAIQSAEEYTGGLNATLSSMAGTITTATEAQALSNAEADNTTSKLGEEITAFNGLSESQQQLAIDISNSVLTMQQNLQSSVEQQMGLFDTLDTGVETSMAEIIEGLDSQITGVEDWERNLNTLIDWGINQDLLQTLIEAGPQTGSAVQAMIDAGSEEVGKLSEKWKLKESVMNVTNEAGQALKTNATEYLGEGFLELSNATQEDIDALSTVMSDGFRDVGTFSSQGLAEGIQEAASQATDAAEVLGEDVLDKLSNVMQIGSPSEITTDYGKWIDEGLQNGIDRNAIGVRNAAGKLGKGATEAVKSGARDTRSIGMNIAYGIRDGINLGASSVINAAANMAARAAQAAKNTLQIHSPSKVFEEIGAYTTEGFAQGIENSAAMAELERNMNAMFARAQSLTIASQNYAPITDAIQAIPAGNTEIQIVVNAAEGQNAEEIANAVMYQMQHAVQQKKAVWG